MLDFEPDDPIAVPQSRKNQPKLSFYEKCQYVVLFLVFMLVFINLLVLFAIYGYFNPEAYAVVGTLPNGEMTIFPSVGEAVDFDAFRIDEVHANMTKWSSAGFWLLLAPLIPFTVMIQPFVGDSMQKWTSFCMIIEYVFIVVTMLIWWILGFMCRFSETGRYASGDIPPDGVSDKEWIAAITSSPTSMFQYYTGAFMLMFYQFSVILMGLCLVSLVCWLLYTYCLKPCFVREK